MDTLSLPELVPVTSSNVAAVGHRGTDLFVRFRNGGLYRYEAVPAEVFRRLLAAESPGKFLNAEVKPFHVCRKLEGTP